MRRFKDNMKELDGGWKMKGITISGERQPFYKSVMTQ